MRLPIGLAAMLAFIAVLTLGSSTSSAAHGNAVVHWSDVASSAISTGRPPASSSVFAGMVHGAVYDAVAAFEDELEPFVVDLSAPGGASVDAAVAQAARDVLVNCMTAATLTVPSAPCLGSTPRAAVELAFAQFKIAQAIADDDPGLQVGEDAAAAMLASRETSGFGAAIPYSQPTPGPGVFEPIATTPVVDVMLAKVTPFTYESPAYRPDPPYALTSKKYAADVAELKDVGRATSTTRTDAQTKTALFYSENTFVQYSRALRGLVNEQSLDVKESARFLGYAWVAIGDTMIACWDAKFAYMFWRPNHAIQRAESDGNPATGPNDSTWTPMLTGNHPEYPSGHGCFTSALGEVLHRYFGSKEVPFTVTSTVTHNGAALLPRTYMHTKDLSADVQDARVWGGLHYRATVVETSKHFWRIARDVGKSYFLADEE